MPFVSGVIAKKLSTKKLSTGKISAKKLVRQCLIIAMIVFLSGYNLIAIAGESTESANALTAISTTDDSTNSAKGGARNSSQNSVKSELLHGEPQEVPVANDVAKRETHSKSTGASVGSPMSELPGVILTLFLLVFGIFALAWLARRYGSLGLSKGNHIKVNSTIPVGGRERVSLIEVEGRKILIGITAQNISHLHTFDESDSEAISDSVEEQNRTLNSPFAEKFRSVLNKVDRTNHESLSSVSERRVNND